MDAEILVKMREREGREMGVLKAKVEEIKRELNRLRGILERFGGWSFWHD
jgi:hypothetical protein